MDKELKPHPQAIFNDYYYGVSPKIDNAMIISAISEKRFSSLDGLDSFISEHCDQFMLHTNQADYLLAFARHAVITFASHFGIKLALPEETATELLKEPDFNDILKLDNGVVEVHGCPTEELLNRLSSFRFLREETQWKIDKEGIPFGDIYKQTDNILLLSGRVFYSGVLFKPVKLSLPDQKYENDAIKNLCVFFERTTFATVCSFDQVHINHPLLGSSRNALLEFFRKDDEAKIRLKEKMSAATSELETCNTINDYLLETYNVNQIGVSATLSSLSDDTLFLGLRDEKNIDARSLYPGVNGNAELKDPNVSFYTYSKIEDYPSVDTRQSRISFEGEIARELYGELKLEHHNNWTCIGMVISGQIPQKPISDENLSSHTSRRMHFNIIFEYPTDLSHSQIQESRNKACEAYETAFFKGIKICYYKTYFDRVVQSASKLMKSILNQKELLESLVLILLTASSFISNRNGGALSLLEILSMFFAVLIIVKNIFDLSHLISKKRHWKKLCEQKGCNTTILRIYKKDSYEKLCQKLKKTLNCKCHPVAFASTKMHIENLIYDRTFNDTDK